jgi:hypothetical protein
LRGIASLALVYGTLEDMREEQPGALKLRQDRFRRFPIDSKSEGGEQILRLPAPATTGGIQKV